MKKLIVIVTLIATILYGCEKDTPQTYEPKPEPQKIEQPETTPTPITQPPETENVSLEEAVNETSPNTIKIATFNIRIFGKSKREKEDVMQVLEKIVRNFDIVAVQEFRDKSQTTLPYFVNRINAMQGDEYGYVGSPRLGRSTSKERYAFIYNKRTVNFRGISYVYNDSLDIFEREPFIAAFNSGNFDYTLVNIHTKPTDATAEIQALVDVVKDADEHVPDDKDVIVLGDYNADGSYFSERIRTGLRDDKYLWIVPDHFDTTVAKNTYTYDRIVAQKEYTKEDFAGGVEVLRFDTIFSLDVDFTKQVSDHFPVWALFYTNKDTD